MFTHKRSYSATELTNRGIRMHFVNSHNTVPAADVAGFTQELVGLLVSGSLPESCILSALKKPRPSSVKASSAEVNHISLKMCAQQSVISCCSVNLSHISILFPWDCTFDRRKFGKEASLRRSHLFPLPLWRRVSLCDAWSCWSDRDRFSCTQSMPPYKGQETWKSRKIWYKCSRFCRSFYMCCRCHSVCIYFGVFSHKFGLVWSF